MSSSNIESREVLGRLLATQQQLIDLKFRLDREHQVGEGFRRFSERALGTVALSAFWELATEEIVSTFGTENAPLLRLAEEATLCGQCCAADVSPEELATFAVLARETHAAQSTVLTLAPLPRLLGADTSAVLIATYLDAEEDVLYGMVATVSASKAPFYPTFDSALGPLFAAFCNHVGALQAHHRGRIEAARVSLQLQRLAEVASRTSNGVLILGRDSGVQWVNEDPDSLPNSRSVRPRAWASSSSRRSPVSSEGSSR